MRHPLLAFAIRFVLSAAALWLAVAVVSPGNPANTFGRAALASLVLSVAFYVTLAKLLSASRRRVRRHAHDGARRVGRPECLRPRHPGREGPLRGTGEIPRQIVGGLEQAFGDRRARDDAGPRYGPARERG